MLHLEHPRLLTHPTLLECYDIIESEGTYKVVLERRYNQETGLFDIIEVDTTLHLSDDQQYSDAVAQMVAYYSRAAALDFTMPGFIFALTDREWHSRGSQEVIVDERFSA